jgi:hypothetical protein
MRLKLVLCLLLLAAMAFAKEPKAYQSGKLLQMDSVPCGVSEKGGIWGSNSPTQKTREVLCQEYVLQAERVIYRIRPRDEKHPVLLPVGGQAQFRMQKDKMLLRVEDLDNKEREYIVVSMTPRTDSDTADSTPVHVNHLQ